MPLTRVVGNRYELGDALGYGGMADVFRGRDVRLGRDVAVKLLRTDLARDQSFHGRFRREAQAAASLNHPSIVSVFDTGDDEAEAPDGTHVPYIVMEYVEGSTLRDVLLSEGPLPPKRALRLVADVCAALNYSHQAGIVHRDVKPGNVMLTPRGEVKVMDFGIARAMAASGSTTMTQTASVVGTAQYLSPEQARGEDVDARSDIYSTGCLLYELVTGVPPFRGDSAVAVAYQHVREDALPPSEMIEGVSPQVDAVVLKAMAKNPGNRYQNAAEMQEDLERAAAGQAVLAPLLDDGRLHAAAPVTAVPPVVADVAVLRQPQRRSGRGWLFVLLGLLVVGVFIAAILLTRALLGDQSTVVETPNLIGLQTGQAQTELAKQGLGLGHTDQRFDDRPVGTIIEQNPSSTISSRRGGKVDIVVSKGVEMIPVPQLATKQQDDAFGILMNAGLTVGTIRPEDGQQPKGTVLRSMPDADVVVPAKSPVSLVVASGNNTVPDVTGQSFETGQQAVREAGFGVRPVPQETTSAAPGTILSQDPRNGVSPLGTTVDLVVAVPPPPPPPTPTFSPFPTPTSTSSIDASATPTASPTGTPARLTPAPTITAPTPGPSGG